jgi:hypothetical protein
MSKQEPEEEANLEDFETIVYIPDLSVYGTITRYGAWASMINYFSDGFSYTIEMPNDEFEVIDEVGVGYLEEYEEGVGYPDYEEEDDL